MKKKSFNPHDLLSFEYASDEPLVYKNEILYSAETLKQITEIQYVEFANTVIYYLFKDKEQSEHLKIEIDEKLDILINKFYKHNTLEAIKKAKQDELENNKNKIIVNTKVELKINFDKIIRKRPNNQCWKCRSLIIKDKFYQCQSCGFYSYLDNDKLLDEWEYWEGNSNRQDRLFNTSSLLDVFSGLHVTEKAYLKLSKNSSDLDILMKSLLSEVNKINSIIPIDYGELSQIYNNIAFYLYDSGIYFYEFLWNSKLSELLMYKNQGIKQVRLVANNIDCELCDDCGWCKSNHKKIYNIDDAIKQMPLPYRKCKDTGYYDYDGPDDLIKNGMVIGYCHARWSTCIEGYDEIEKRMKEMDEEWKKNK